MTDIPALEQLKKETITLDDLLTIEGRVEIIDGEVIEMPAAGMMHHLIVANINRILDRYVYEKQTGYVLPDGMTYLMNSSAQDLRGSYVPDVSFIRLENIPQGWDAEKPFPGVPDLAVEVVSPHDNAQLLEIKALDYLQKGTAQVWLVYPKGRRLYQYVAPQAQAANVEIRIYGGAQSPQQSEKSEKIEAETLFPGIEGLTTAAIFHLPAWAIGENKPPA